MKDLDISRISKNKAQAFEKPVDLSLLKVKPVIAATSQPQTITPVPAAHKGIFKKFVLVPFTLVVLVIGIFLGTRFVNFARSVTFTKNNIYQDISQGIGATLGKAIPALKGLDNSKVSEAIANKRSINILLLGYGGGNHSGNYLTDTMMVAHVDFSNDKISLIAIPRDLWVKIPTKGYDGNYAKINAAFTMGLDKQNYPNKLPQFSGAQGAGNISKYEASQVLGIPIDYYASIDFSGFKEIVDSLNGVNINVENSFTDYTYPNGDENVNGPICSASLKETNSTCRYKIVHFDAGEQYMSGTQALEYVRSRHALGPEGSDFARSKRQQKLISAIEAKALQWGAVTKIFSLMGAVQGHFQTDLSVAETKDLSGYLNNINFDQAQRISITNDQDNLLVSTYSADGQWILYPRQGIDHFNEVHEYIREALNGITWKPNQNVQSSQSSLVP